MNHACKNKSVLFIENFSSHEIFYLLEHARIMKNSPPSPSLKTSILATCFYEFSIRTRLAFETAMLKLGGRIGFSNVLILRPPSKEYLAHKSTKTPVIHAGNGTEEHPTQTLTERLTSYDYFRRYSLCLPLNYLSGTQITPLFTIGKKVT